MGCDVMIGLRMDKSYWIPSIDCSLCRGCKCDIYVPRNPIESITKPWANDLYASFVCVCYCFESYYLHVVLVRTISLIKADKNSMKRHNSLILMVAAHFDESVSSFEPSSTSSCTKTSISQL